MRTLFGRATFLCWLIPAGLWLGGGRCTAQEAVVDNGQPLRADAAAGGSPVEASPKPRPGSSDTAEHRLDLRYIQGPDGQPVLVPDVTWEEFVKWRDAPDREGPPRVTVSGLEFTGSAEDERVLLTANVELQVLTDSWVRVPLQMSEATLRAAPVHQGKGLAFPAKYNPKEGFTWWIKGKGDPEWATQKLTLALAVPIRKQAAQRRVQLSLPLAGTSSLKLRVPAPRIAAKVPEGATLSTKSVGQETEIEVIGLRNNLDLTWQSLPESNGAAAALDVTTSVVATLSDGETATLEATQLIQSQGQQGTFDEIRVSVPRDCEILRLEGPDVREHNNDPANRNLVVIQLKKPTSGPVELKWLVRLKKLPPVGQTFALEGFEVERAGWQRGYVALVVTGEFRIVRQPDEDKYLQRVDLADLPGGLRQSQASAAYRFLNRLLLRMKLQRIEPYVTVDPAIAVHLASDAVELDAGFRLQVQRAAIGGFRFRWPGWKQQGWTNIEAELPGHNELRPEEEPGDPDVIRLEFVEPLKGTIDLRLRARKVLADLAERVPLNFPVAEAFGRFPTPLALLSADNIEADLRPEETTLLRPVGTADPRILIPRDWTALRRADYRIESPQADLTLAVSIHPRKIQATASVEASISSSAVKVRQRIAYDVAYERIAQLRFAIPEGVPPEQLRFFLAAGKELKELSAGLAPSTGRSPAEIRVTLDAPAIGRFEVEVRFALDRTSPAQASREATLSVPVVQSNDAVYSAMRFSGRDAAGRDVAVGENGWLRQLSADGTPVWTLPQARALVTLHIGRAEAVPQGGLVSRTFIRTRISADGTLQSRAQYKIAEGISELPVSLPAQIEPLGFWWNDTPIHVGPAARSADGATEYEIVLPEDRPARGRLLTIDFLERTGVPSRLSAGYVLSGPQLSDVQSAARVHWQIELPYQQHLFTEPELFFPEYRWRAGRPFWSREPDLSIADLEQWIGAVAGPPLAAGPAGGNRYVFGAFGAPAQLEFRAMSQGGILLISAGAALGLGLLLIYRPVLRHVLTFLTIAFLVALLGVWFAAPVEVLLQPALVGVVLAVLAALIQGFLKRRSRPVTVTLTAPGGFMPPSSAHARSPLATVGSNDFTSVGTPPEAPRAAGQLSEAGNRV